MTAINRGYNSHINVQSNFETETSKVSSESSSQSNSTLYMLRDYLDVYQTKLLIDSDALSGLNTTFTTNSTINITLTTAVTLCQNELCCDFQVSCCAVASFYCH